MKRMFLACLTFLVAGVLVAGCGKSKQSEESTPEYEEAVRKAKEIMEDTKKN